MIIKNIFKYSVIFSFVIFLAALFLAPHFSLAQIDCATLLPDDLKKPESCLIYKSSDECQKNICNLDVSCSWDDQQNKCFFQQKRKELEIKHYPNLPGYGTLTPETTPAEYIRYVFIFGLWILGIISLSMLIYAGLLWFFSGASSEAKSSAMRIVQNIVIGIFLFLATYLILNTINPELLVSKKYFTKELKTIKLVRPKFCDDIPVSTCDDYHKLLGNDPLTTFFNRISNHRTLYQVQAYCNLNICDLDELCEWDANRLSTTVQGFLNFFFIDYKGGACISSGKELTIGCSKMEDVNKTCYLGPERKEGICIFDQKYTYLRCVTSSAGGQCLTAADIGKECDNGQGVCAEFMQGIYYCQKK